MSTFLYVTYMMDEYKLLRLEIDVFAANLKLLKVIKKK